ncbi:MAG: rod shape-determining protein MreD [Acidobacteriota bacterium]
MNRRHLLLVLPVTLLVACLVTGGLSALGVTLLDPFLIATVVLCSRQSRGRAPLIGALMGLVQDCVSGTLLGPRLLVLAVVGRACAELTRQRKSEQAEDRVLLSVGAVLVDLIGRACVAFTFGLEFGGFGFLAMLVDAVLCFVVLTLSAAPVGGARGRRLVPSRGR